MIYLLKNKTNTSIFIHLSSKMLHICYLLAGRSVLEKNTEPEPSDLDPQMRFWLR